ncbi:MAG: dimethylsulfonioproprionate lyase family protein [Hyphomicrobiaceae bacterium]
MTSHALDKVDLSPFLRAAAAAMRAGGVAGSADMARRLEAHADARSSAHLRDGHAGKLPALAHLATTLVATGHLPCIDLVAPIAHRLDWTEGDFVMPESFRGRYAFVTLVGEGAAIPDSEIYFGLYLQSPDTFYPSHWHAAEEIYTVLSGTALWQRGKDAFAPKPPGSQILHLTYEPHAMDTKAEPLLAMWSWTGEIHGDTYEIET